MTGFADYRPEATRAPAEGVAVRPAVDDDLEACARLIVSRTGGSVGNRKARLLGDLTDPDRYSVVAYADHHVIGYGGVIRHELTPPDTAPTGYYLVGLIVDLDWRRRGVGEALTLDRMRWVSNRADEVWYFANLANGATLDLHARLGFVEVTRDFTFPGAPLKPGTGVLLRAPLPVRELGG